MSLALQSRPAATSVYPAHKTAPRRNGPQSAAESRNAAVEQGAADRSGLQDFPADGEQESHSGVTEGRAGSHNGSHKPWPRLWRVFFHHVFDVDGITSNTYTLAEAIDMARRWSPRFVAKASLVPAGAALVPGPSCDRIGPGRPPHERCSGAACSCSCHGLRETLA